MNALIAARKITAPELAEVPTPPATATHQPVSHAAFAAEVEFGLRSRGMAVIRQEYAVSPDGMRMFGLMVTDREFDGCNYAVGLRNSNDKSMKVGLVAGYRVVVCENMAFSGDFTPLVAKHTSRFSLEDSVAIAVNRAFRLVESVGWQVSQLRSAPVDDRLAEETIYRAFVPRDGLRLPKQVMDSVHQGWHSPAFPEFEPRNAWSLHNAFTSAFKELRPVRQFEETGRLTPFIVKATGAYGTRRVQ